MIHISRKKGFILALALYFVILATITSVGIYAYSEHIVREARIGKTSSARGYYCSVAGARYAYILLQNPETNFGFNKPGRTGFDGETYTFTIGPSSTGLGHDLNLSGNDTITITVTEATNNYQVVATFNT